MICGSLQKDTEGYGRVLKGTEGYQRLSKAQLILRLENRNKRFHLPIEDFEPCYQI